VHQAAACLRDRGISLTEACPEGIEEVLAINEGISRVGRQHNIDPDQVYKELPDVTIDALREAYSAALEPARALKASNVQPGVEYYLWTGKADLYRSRLLSFMERFDAILCPVMGYPAQPHRFSERPDFDLRGFVGYTHPYSIVGWPSVAVPAGTSAEELPIDVQIVARPWRDDVALALSQLIEADLGGWRRPLGVSVSPPVLAGCGKRRRATKPATPSPGRSP
jgi:amidase